MGASFQQQGNVGCSQGNGRRVLRDAIWVECHAGQGVFLSRLGLAVNVTV
jgi:hypothetical protein